MAEKKKDDVQSPVTPTRMGLTETVPGRAPAEPRHFQVKLRDCPARIVEAEDAYYAEKLYRQACGIIKTENEFEITEVTGQPAVADAVARGELVTGK